MIEPARPLAGRPDVYALPLVGKLFLQEAPELEARLKEAVESGAKHLLLECAKLQQMDSTIMRVIIAGIRMLHSKSGGKVAFVAPTTYVSRLLTLTRLDQFSIRAKDEAEALAQL